MEMILIVGFLLTAASVFHAFRSAEEDGSDPLREALDGGALVLDVRTVFEFHAGHVDGAVNIPVEDLEARLAELGATSRAIVVYSRTGAMSRSAAVILRQAGYRVVDAGPMSALAGRSAS
ncbi:MAG: phage shock protein E [Myxococcota bacterium]|jgi:phage shock protein E